MHTWENKSVDLCLLGKIRMGIYACRGKKSSDLRMQGKIRGRSMDAGDKGRDLCMHEEIMLEISACMER